MVNNKLNILKNMMFLSIVVALMALVGCSNGGSGSKGESSSSDTDKTFELDYAHFYPPQQSLVSTVIEPFIENVYEQTDGRIKITQHVNESLVSATDTYDATVTGLIDIGESIASYTPGLFPLATIAELPLNVPDGETISEVLWRLYEEFPEFQAEFDETVPLWFTSHAPGQLLTVGKQVKTVDDIKGMRIRVPSPYVGKLIEKAGGIPVTMTFNEVYEALERGVIDGFVGPATVLKDYGFNEVVDYMTIGNFYTLLHYTVMNKDVYDSLNDEDQEIIKELAGLDNAVKAGKAYDENQKDSLENYSEGVEIYELTDEDLATWEPIFSSVAEAWIEEMESNDLPGQEMYNRALELVDEITNR